MNTLRINTSTNFEEFFSKSGYFNCTKLSQWPYVVFNEVNSEDEKSEVSVQIITSHKELLQSYKHMPETKVMQQWNGRWNSIFITFTVGDVINYIKSNDILLERFKKFL